MPDSDLRAVVVGAGWAGEGHTKALQSAGVKVEAICARKRRVVEAVARSLGVPTASTDWETTVRDVRPDIVAVATPGGLRREVIEVACQVESHVVCDKPLGTSAEAASDYYKLVKDAGVKHAFAATHRYDPSVAWAAKLLQEGKIGYLAEMDLVLIAPFLKATTPWSWSDVLADGGGMLNNALPHFLGMIERMINGSATWVTGEARVLRRSAPFVPDLHDWRQVMGTELTEQEAEKLDWRTAMLTLPSLRSLNCRRHLQGLGRSSRWECGLTCQLPAHRPSTGGISLAKQESWSVKGFSPCNSQGETATRLRIFLFQTHCCRRRLREKATSNRSGVPWRETSYPMCADWITCPTSRLEMVGATKSSLMPSETGPPVRFQWMSD